MMKTEQNDQIIFDQPGGESKLPQIVYKYRSWTDNRHKEIISKQIVFMANPASFEDPKDSKLCYDNLNEEDRFEFLQCLQQRHPEWQQQRLEEYVRDYFKNPLLKDKEYNKQEQSEYLTECNRRTGVLSLTLNRKRYEMWDKYSDHHHGFCVGFDTKKLNSYFYDAGKVQYFDELFVISPFVKSKDESIMQGFSKKTIYSYEEEYRLREFYPKPVTNDEDRRTGLTEECYKEIIFGAYMPECHKQEIISICRDQKIVVKYFCAVISGKEITISEY